MRTIKSRIQKNVHRSESHKQKTVDSSQGRQSIVGRLATSLKDEDYLKAGSLIDKLLKEHNLSPDEISQKLRTFNVQVSAPSIYNYHQGHTDFPEKVKELIANGDVKFSVAIFEKRGKKNDAEIIQAVNARILHDQMKKKSSLPDFNPKNLPMQLREWLSKFYNIKISKTTAEYASQVLTS